MKLNFLLKSLILSSVYFSVANTEIITSIETKGNKRVDYDINISLNQERYGYSNEEIWLGLQSNALDDFTIKNRNNLSGLTNPRLTAGWISLNMWNND